MRGVLVLLVSAGCTNLLPGSDRSEAGRDLPELVDPGDLPERVDPGDLPERVGLDAGRDLSERVDPEDLLELRDASPDTGCGDCGELPLYCCVGACVDLSSDPGNCWRCSWRCQGLTPVCQGGVCSARDP